jgi:AraC-like DNA-binding protein
MKATLEHLSLNNNHSFHYRKICKAMFDGSYHFHPEFELTYIESGAGQRFIGSHTERFSDGDLVFIGSNLPHCWISDVNSSKTEAIAIVIQFKVDFFGKEFFNFPEMKLINDFLKIANSGVEIGLNYKQLIIEKMKGMEFDTPIERFQSLIFILGVISQAADNKLIDISFSNKKYNTSNNERFQNVFSYLISNYTKQIDLAEIASVAHMSKTSFCRFFKQITNKTFVEVIFEFRFEKACFLLKNSHLSIQQICFESGFSDVPFFNKVFKKKYNITPGAYRRVIKNDRPI